MGSPSDLARRGHRPRAESCRSGSLGYRRGRCVRRPATAAHRSARRTRRRTRHLHRADPRGPRPSSRRVADRFVAIDSRVRFMTASDPRPDMTEVIGNDDLLPLILDTQSAGRRAAVERPAPKGEGSPRPSVRRGTSVGLCPEPPLEQASLATIPEHAMRWGFLDPIPARVAVDTSRASRWIRRARRGGHVVHDGVDASRASCWMRRAGRGGHAVQVAVDMPCRSRWTCRAGRGGHAVQVAVDMPCRSRWTCRAGRGGHAVQVAVDMPCRSRWTCRAGRGGHAVHVAVNTPCTSRRIRRAGYALSVAVDTPQSRRRTTGLSDRVEPILR